MQAETCCSLPRTPAICSTDCTETHTASAAATPLGERVTRGSTNSSGLSPLYVVTALTCSYWLGCQDTRRIISYVASDKPTVCLIDFTQAGRRTKRKAREVFWCLFLTDERCPLLTLSGKLETGVERVKPQSNGCCKLGRQITQMPAFSVTANSGKWVPTHDIWMKEIWKTNVH